MFLGHSAKTALRMRLPILCFTCTSLLLSTHVHATEYFVSSAAQIATAMQTAQPGDVLTMTNGNWTNQRIQFAGNGTSSLPITLRAQTAGQVTLNGNSKLNISGSYLTVDGLD